MKPLRVGLLLLGLLSLGEGALRADDVAIGRTMPRGAVTDDAGFLAPDAQERVLTRLRQFYSAGAPRGQAHRPGDFQLQVYTLKSAGRSSPDRFLEELYRSWRSVAKTQGTYVERQVTLFLFLAERQARVVSGNEISPEIRQAVKGIEPDLPSLFVGRPEAALLSVIDRIASLTGVPAAYHDPPVVPSDPGSIFGGWRWSDGVREALSGAAAKASVEAGHPIVLASDPELNHFSPRQGAEHLAAAWPGRTILLLSHYPTDSSELLVVLRPADQLASRFPKAQVERIERQVLEASKGDELDRTLVRLLGEIGSLAARQRLETWSPWKHPIQALTGGRDASSDARLVASVNGFFKLALLVAVLGWLWFFFHDPREATVGLLYFLLNAFLGSLGGSGGGGGGGSSGFSGGGGSSGGGGASGSW
jgi:uncharacterized membrane protein YgcG